MKVLSKIFLVCAVSLATLVSPAFAQVRKSVNATVENSDAVVDRSAIHTLDIFKELELSGKGQGVVNITQSAKMQTLFDIKEKSIKSKKYVYINGYRIQVYMGNKQKESKNEVYNREKKIKEKFEDITTYVSFTSPFWKLRVGDFRNQADALVLAQKLKSEFPEISSEIYVVKDDEVRDVELEKMTVARLKNN